MPFPAIALAAAPLLGKIFGGAGKGAADQRITENQQRLQQAQMANQHALSSAGMDLQRKAFLQQEPNAQAGQALRGSLLSRIQPLRMTGVSDRVRIPQMNSIIDAIGPEARQAGSLLAGRGVSGLQNPTQFAPMPSVQLGDLQKSSLLEKILGTVGLIGSTVGAFSNLGSAGGGSMNNAMPSNYTGLDLYGNPSNWQLPRIELGDIHEGLG